MSHRIASRMILSLVLAAALGCTNGNGQGAGGAPAPTTAAPIVPGALDAAHDAYLEGDFLTVGERVRDLLLDPRSSELVKENALALLEKSYEVGKGSLPSRFVLPPGFEGIKYGVVHGSTGEQPYNRIYLYGNTRDASKLARVTVRLLPDETLLDGAAGNFLLKHDKPGFDTFVVERALPELPRDGVISLRLELTDGTIAEGWFIAHALASSSTPEVLAPGWSASLSDPNPVVSWKPFRSPEYASFEHRTLSVWVALDGAKAVAWDYWTQDYGELGSVRVGDHRPAGTVKLATGEYWMSVSCGEVRSFGPIAMARESRSTSSFHVVP